MPDRVELVDMEDLEGTGPFGCRVVGPGHAEEPGGIAGRRPVQANARELVRVVPKEAFDLIAEEGRHLLPDEAKGCGHLLYVPPQLQPPARPDDGVGHGQDVFIKDAVHEPRFQLVHDLVHVLHGDAVGVQVQDQVVEAKEVGTAPALPVPELGSRDIGVLSRLLLEVRKKEGIRIRGKDVPCPPAQPAVLHDPVLDDSELHPYMPLFIRLEMEGVKKAPLFMQGKGREGLVIKLVYDGRIVPAQIILHA